MILLSSALHTTDRTCFKNIIISFLRHIWDIFCTDLLINLVETTLWIGYPIQVISLKKEKIYNFFLHIQNVTYLSIVTFQVADILKSCWRIDLDDIAMDGGKDMPTIAEWTLRVQTQEF